MTAEPNAFDVLIGGLIAQAQAYAVLVHLLENLEVLPAGATRDALDRMIEHQGSRAPVAQLAHLNEILKQLSVPLPLQPGRQI